MSLSSAHVTHGKVTRIEGDLSPVAQSLLRRQGAFFKEDSWWVAGKKWPAVESVLKACGVRIQQQGKVELHTSLWLDQYGRLCMRGFLPKRLDKTWLGHMQGTDYVGFTPYAIGDILAELEAQGVDVEADPGVMELRDRIDTMLEEAACTRMGLNRPVIDLESGALWDHQRDAVALADATQGRFWCMDACGTGKSLTAIATKRHLGAQRIIVIAPTVAKGNWRDEITRFDGGSVFIMDGQKPQAMPRTQWYVINPELLQHRIGELVALKPDMVIADESHRFKSPSAHRSKALMQLAQNVQYFVALSGTPIPNTLVDLHTVAHCIQPNWWGSQWDFGMAFGDPERNHWASNKAGRTIYQFKGTTEENLPILRARLSAFTIRRELSEVRDVPPQTRTVYRVPLPSRAQHQYQAVKDEYKAFLAELLDGVPDAQRERVLDKAASDRAKHALKLREVASLGRVQATKELAETYIEQGQRPIIFAFFRNTITALEKAFKGHRLAVIHGDVPGPKRDDIARRFNDGELDVLVAQIQAGGESINLDRGSHLTITHELTYEPIHITQSEGRVYRATQKHPVQHIYTVGEGTIEETIVRRLLDKIRGGDAVLRAKTEESQILADFEASL